MAKVTAGNKVKEREKLLSQLDEVKYEIQAHTLSINDIRSATKSIKLEFDDAKAKFNIAKAATDAFATRPVKVTLIPAKPKTQLDILIDKLTTARRRRDQLERDLTQIENQIDRAAVRKSDLDFDAGRHRLALSRLEPDREPHLLQLHKLEKIREWRVRLEEEKAMVLGAYDKTEREIDKVEEQLELVPISLDSLAEQIIRLRSYPVQAKQELAQIRTDYNKSKQESVEIEPKVNKLRLELDKAQAKVTALDQNRDKLKSDLANETAASKYARNELVRVTLKLEAVEADIADLKLKIAALETLAEPVEPDPELIRQANKAQLDLRRVEGELSRARAQLGGMKIEQTCLTKQITPAIGPNLEQANAQIASLEAKLANKLAPPAQSRRLDAEVTATTGSILEVAKEELIKWRTEAATLEERVHPVGRHDSAPARRTNRPSTAASSVGGADYAARTQAQAAAYATSIKALQAIVDEYTKDVAAKKLRNTELLVKSVGFKAPVWAL